MELVDVVAELDGADLGDARRERRLRSVVARLQAHPDCSYPRLFGESELEGFYRFVENDEVTPEAILEPHVKMTVGRASACREVLIIHDTTEISHGKGSPGSDFYDLQNSRFGYRVHVSLAVNAENNLPLGVANVIFVERDPDRVQTTDSKERWMKDDKESLRWRDAVEATARLLPDPIHVMDREGDSYELLYWLCEWGCRFVIRAHHDRRVTIRPMVQATMKLREKLSGTKAMVHREVPLSKRVTKGRGRNSNPPRRSRVAKLEISASPVELRRPRNLPGTGEKGLPTRLRLNAVYVREVDVPEGEEPIEWVLYTSEPIDTEEALTKVVDVYTSRWQIEEFFKALKTGCAFEARQFERRCTEFCVER